MNRRLGLGAWIALACGLTALRMHPGGGGDSTPMPTYGGEQFDVSELRNADGTPTGDLLGLFRFAPGSLYTVVRADKVTVQNLMQLADSHGTYSYAGPISDKAHRILDAWTAYTAALHDARKAAQHAADAAAGRGPHTGGAAA